MNNIVVENPELNTLCISCMQCKGHSEQCPQCGYDERKYKKHPLYLKPRTLLKNQYVIGIPLGQGGFGITYLGQDLWLQKKVAIKEYLPATLATRDLLTSTIIPLKKQEETFNKGLQLFIDEARNLAKFDHPNIVRVNNFFEENQTGYTVMDYLEGLSLTDILSQAGGCLSVDEALTIILPIFEALAEIHAQHIYHRDISIQNTRILTAGVPILIDFGAARHIVGEHSRTLDLVLKHGYSPLEQYSGKGKIGPWTDIYACGALLYLMLTGTLPPAATDRYCEDNLIAPAERGVAISTSINEAIMRALAIKFEKRFQTVQAFKAALLGTASVDTPVPLSTLSPQLLNHKRRKGHRKTIAMSAASVLFVLLMMSMSLFSYFREETLSLKSLFVQAQAQWARSKLTMPVGDNAYETYQQILEIAPNNAQAKAGLLKIAEHYQHLAQVAFDAGAFPKSLETVQQGLQVMPNHADLLAFEQNVIAQIAAGKQAQARAAQVKQLLSQAAQHLAMSQLEAAIIDYQKVFVIEPDNQPARSGLQQVAEKYVQLARTPQVSLSSRLSFINKGLTVFPDHQGLLALKKALLDEKLAQQRKRDAKRAQQRKIDRLLKKAARQLAVLRLTTPVGDNAYKTYQKILRMDPDNPQVQVGLRKIADKYEQLARIERDDLQKNLDFIDKGLKVIPTHAGLNALRQTLTEQMQEVITQPEPSYRVFDATQPAQPQEIQPIYDEYIVEQPILLPQEKPPEPNKTVQDLLAIALQHFERVQFEAAYQTYRNVLMIDPGNMQATTGLQQLAYRYEQLAKIQNKKGDLHKSLFLIKKGLAAYPAQSLLTLQAKVIRRIKQKNSIEAQAPSHIIFTPSF